MFSIDRANSLRGVASAMYGIAIVLAIASIAASSALLSQHAAADASSHPHDVAGWMVLIGGCAQAALFVAVGRIATAIGEMRPR